MPCPEKIGKLGTIKGCGPNHYVAKNPYKYHDNKSLIAVTEVDDKVRKSG